MSIKNVPSVGLRTFRLKGEAVKQAVIDAINVGYRHIDTAAIYRNEVEIGSALQEIYNKPCSNVRRSDLWITSKLSPYDMKNPQAALLKSLTDLRTTYLDLYLIHWPAAARKSASSPENKMLRIEAWKVLNEAKRDGLVSRIGVSNFTPQHLNELMHETEFGIQGAFVQMEIHPWYWRDALKIQTVFAQQDIVLVGYALLGEGRLLQAGCSENLTRIAGRLGVSRIQIVLVWALKKGWGVLVRSNDEDHLRQNFDAPKLVEALTDQDYAAIDAITSLDSEQKLCWDPRLVT